MPASKPALSLISLPTQAKSTTCGATPQCICMSVSRNISKTISSNPFILFFVILGYNIFDRTIENNGLKEEARKLNKGVICFSPLEQGMLTDRYLNGIPDDSRVKTDGRFLNESQINEEKIAKIRALNLLAMERNQTLAQMALAWILKDDVITSVLVGASKPRQIADSIKAINNTNFTEEELKRIDDIIK